MMEDKNLDKLFQEQLQNLEVTPHQRVWSALETKLKKKKRRIVPIWWFSSGIAAILVLGFFMFPTSKNTVLKDQIKENPLLISSPKKDVENTNTILKEKDTLFQKNKENTLLTEEKVIPKNKKRAHFQKEDNLKKNPVIVAKKVLKNSEKEKMNTQKDAMEKTFLAEETVLKKEIENSNGIKIKEGIIAENRLGEKKDKLLKDFIKTKKEGVAKKEDIRNSIKKEEVLDVEDLTKKTWTVTPVFAVLNSNSFSNTSPVDKSLGNSTEGNNSYSYGVKVAYQLTSKLTFQSGIHIQEMSFSNREIAVIPSNSSTSNLVLDNPENFVFGESSQGFSDINTLSLNSSLEGNLNQKYGYIEIPLEVKYQLLENKKFNTQLVAGFSSLILNKNQIEINTSTDSRTGKVDNLNSLNFSGNLGMDFNYTFQENWSLHVNPMFKAQLNTFTKNANGFKPYFIGVYTGINYRF